MTQTITPYLLYEDVDAALEFLERAFGFQEHLRFTGPEGYVNHAEARLGDAAIYLGDPGDHYKNPKRLGQETVGIYVLVDDVDRHYEQARAPAPRSWPSPRTRSTATAATRRPTRKDITGSSRSRFTTPSRRSGALP